MPNGRITLITLNQKLDYVIKQQDSHDKLLRGDESTPGFLTRVDRLEQIENSRKWHIRTVWGAIVAGAVGLWWK